MLNIKPGRQTLDYTRSLNDYKNWSLPLVAEFQKCDYFSQPHKK